MSKKKEVNLITGYYIPSTIIDGSGQGYPQAISEAFRQVRLNNTSIVNGLLVYEGEEDID
jgi:hypothetical protein